MLPSLTVHGDIQMIIGPMFSGKSTELIRRVQKYRAAKRVVQVIKFEADTRYSQSDLSTHDRRQMEAIPASKLDQVKDLVTDAHVIAIDEGQFYPDIIEYAEKWANSGKTVIISALDGTWQRKPFESIALLMALADSVVKLEAVCYKCQQSAPFSARITKEQETVVIGGADKYVACCRKCWHELQNKYKTKFSTPYMEISKLEQFGFTVPSSGDEIVQQRITQYLKLISAQYEQTKDVLWCVLDQPVLPNGVKLEPADAFHAVVSEIHGLLVQASQVHRLYASQFYDQKSISDTLQQQIEQLRKTDPTEQQKQDFNKQIEQIKQVYVTEIEQLKKTVKDLQIQLQQSIKYGVELEKENLMMKTDLVQKTKFQSENDDLTVKKVIYQRDLLETQIKSLQTQKQEFDAQQLQYNQLLELTKTELFQKGIEQHVIAQIQQTTSALTRACADLDQCKLESDQLKQENQRLKKLYETERLQWHNEKTEMKREWQEIYQQLAQQLGM